ncbi:endoplasmic reticulum junction formation protein lunapark-A [Thrips palmi]|uniref:Endoplasmic reticulum junction formation protein lunapark n=1 Tax=Thrips palmi TaxID=161013 RepID=A0A6P8YXP2_THRPL|nr:endoplasmic reticulum junction formation protein lunapark-A [Thrips palmi]XP_034242394.1 endoplasmic reticulum junction formation protein lunapark-A [Thrips palmi]XP_034242395.1 endoplasmic reticulum junction formation protein lunapark-A [Thrips palmi]
MGILISRFKRKKTTLEILEKLEKDITDIERYRTNTEQRQRRIVGQLIVYSVGAYVLAAAIFYFYWFPSTLREQLICVAPLLLFPILVIFLKRIVTFYYSRKITKNEQKLSDLRADKKQILEDVMDKETYKVARTILEKFAPEQLRSKGMEQHLTPMKPNQVKGPQNSAVRPTPLQSSTPVRPVPPGVAPSELRRRTLPSALGNPGTNVGPPSSLSSESLSSAALQRSQFLSGTPVHRPSVNGQSFSSDFRPPGPPLPRPVLPRERTYFERVVEYVVGDGPANRFALICSSCDSHNGMALKEEFEYLPFRCCYCHYFNPARKQRPQAPRLSPISGLKSQGLGQNSVNTTKNPETSESEKNSGSDSSSDEDSGPELLPKDEADIRKTEQGTENKEETTLDREAEEFLSKLAEREKVDEESATASTKED